MKIGKFISAFKDIIFKTIKRFIGALKKMYCVIKAGSDYGRVLTPIKIRNIIFPLVYSAAGFVINSFVNNKFPNYLVFWGLLFVVILITRSTTSSMAKLNSNLDQEMSGDIELVTLKLKYQKQSRSNKNHLFSIGGSLLITYLTYALLHVTLSFEIKIYCLLSLFLIVGYCINGAIQYYYLLVFAYFISKRTECISLYDNELPYRTKWLNLITKEIHFCNTMYFIVGTFIILILNKFIFTSDYGIELNNNSDAFHCFVFWSIIIIFIVIGFPALTIFGYLNICKIISGLKEKSESLIKLAQENANENMRINISRYIIEFNNTPGYPTKHPLSYLISLFVGVINILTSLQSVSSIFTVFVQSIKIS